MKKLLACLLVLLLPCCALAETIALDWSVNVSADGLSLLVDMAQDSLGADSDGPYDAMTATLAELLSGISLRAVVSESGDRYVISMAYQDLELFLFDGQNTDDTMYSVCNLLPGILLTGAYDGSLDSATKEAQEASSKLSWQDVSRRSAPFWPTWAASLDMTEEVGAFAGDAYMGEGRCRTYRFDERDVAVLLDSMLSVDRHDNIDSLLQYYGQLIWDDKDGMTNYLRDSILSAARRNRYRYVLRLVDIGDDAATPIGLSLLVYEADQQIATLSVGYPEKGLDAVLGYGLRGQNYYLAMTMNNTPELADTLTLRLWQDPDKAGYYTASSDENANLLLTAVVSGSSESPDFDATLQALVWGQALGGHRLDMAVTLTESAVHGELITTLKMDSQELLVSTLAAEFVDDLPPLALDGLRVIDIDSMSASEEQLLQEVAIDTGIKLGIELFKALPAELLTLLLTTGVF